MGRLSYSLLLAVVAAIVLMGWALDQWYDSRTQDTGDPVLEAYTALGRELAVWLDARAPGDSPDRPTGSALQSQLMAYADFPLPEDVRLSFEAGEPLLLDSGDTLSLHFYLPTHQQVVSLNLPDTLRNESHELLRWLLTLLFYAGVILVVSLWLLPLLRRLALLRKQAQNFGAGQLTSRIPPDPHSYIYHIEEEFNRMAQRIEQLIADNKLLSRGLSHDLRTPLARLRFGLDVLEESGLNPTQEKYLTHMNRDLLTMEKLVEALLKYARLDQAEISFSPRPLGLAEFVVQICQDFYADEIDLHCAPEASDGQINADPEYLGMLLHNLVQNALNYGRGQVRMALTQHAETLRLCIEDNGPGIAAEERNKVLMPFYRVAQTGAESPQGQGLGLAIVERIAQWHKAQLTLTQSPQLGGLMVELVFSRCY